MNRSKRLTIAIAALLTGAAFGPVSFAQNTTQTPSTVKQQFRQADTNQDGQVSKSEFDNYWKQQFQAADTNRDGKLSRQECETAVRKMEGSRFSQTKFDQMWNDVSQNGEITQSQDMAYHDKQFRQADSNNDGKLSLAEMRRATRSHEQSLASL